MTSLESNDSFLPDFSFCDKIRDFPSSNKSSEQLPSNLTDAMKKVKGCMDKINKYKDYCENKRIIEDDLFNYKGQLKVNPSELKNDIDSTIMDPSHERFLKNLIDDHDPLVPIKPRLDYFFSLDKSKLRIYSLPYIAFDHEFIPSLDLVWPKNEEEYLKNKSLFVLFLLIDNPSLFKSFFNQIPYEATQYNCLNCILLNIPWLSTTCRMFSSFEILTDILDDPVFQEHANWKIDDRLVIQFLQSFELDTAKFLACFPSQSTHHATLQVFLSLHERPSEIVKFQKTCVSVKQADFEIIVTKLQELLILSLHTKSNSYTEQELDYLFYLFTFLVLDSYFSKHNTKVQTQQIFSKISQIFTHQSLWSLQKLDLLATNILKAVLVHKKTNQSVTESDEEKGRLATLTRNNHYHRLLHLIGYFRVSQNKELDKLTIKLSIACLYDMHSFSYELDKPMFDSIEFLVEKAKTMWQQMFANSSYSMFNLLELLDIVVAYLSSNISNNLNKTSLIEAIKLSIQHANKLVKEHPDFRGRVMVKVLISKFENKCDYYYLARLGVSSHHQPRSILGLLNHNSNSSQSQADLDESSLHINSQ